MYKSGFSLYSLIRAPRFTPPNSETCSALQRSRRRVSHLSSVICTVRYSMLDQGLNKHHERNIIQGRWGTEEQCCGFGFGSGSKGSASFCRIRIQVHNIFHGSGSISRSEPSSPPLPSSCTLKGTVQRDFRPPVFYIILTGLTHSPTG